MIPAPERARGPQAGDKIPAPERARGPQAGD